MGVFRPIPDVENFDGFVLPDSTPYSTLEELDGRRHADSWKPLRVLVYDLGSPGDFPNLTSHVPVFSAEALAVLQPLVGQSIEALPLKVRGLRRYYAIHVLELLDCLDYVRSVIKRFPSGGIMDIERYAFKMAVIREKHIFRIREAPEKYVFVSEEFKKLVEKNKLRGLIFKKVD